MQIVALRVPKCRPTAAYPQQPRRPKFRTQTHSCHRLPEGSTTVAIRLATDTLTVLVKVSLVSGYVLSYTVRGGRFEGKPPRPAG